MVSAMSGINLVSARKLPQSTLEFVANGFALLLAFGNELGPEISGSMKFRINPRHQVSFLVDPV